MRLLLASLALALAACGAHNPKQPPAEMSVPIEAPTADHCASAIQAAVDRINAVDFNADRKAEVSRYIAKARAAQSRGDFGKCMSFADKAVQFS